MTLLDNVYTSIESHSNNNNNYINHHGLKPKWHKLVEYHPIPQLRHGHRAVAIKDLMLVFGGGSEGIVNELHAYDTNENRWFIPEVRGDNPPGFAAYGMVTNQTKVFVFGGMVEYGRYSNDLYELQMNRCEWRKLRVQFSPCPRLGHSFTLGLNNIAYVFGGLANASRSPNRRENIPEYLNDFYLIDLSTSPNGLSWCCPQTHGQLPSTRESHTAVYFTTSSADEQLIIYGGMNGHRLGDVWILDLKRMNWSNPIPDGIQPLARSLHTANLIGDRMFIFGGWVKLEPEEELKHPDQLWKCTNTLAVLHLTLPLRWELFDPPSNADPDSWPIARAGHCSAVINKRIYIWSGRDGYKKQNKQGQITQVCCENIYFLETEPPAAPSGIQLVKATINSLEISWSPSTNTERYILQIQRAEHQPDPEKIGRRSIGGVRVGQRQQYFAGVRGTASSRQLTAGGGGSASASPLRAIRPTTTPSSTVTVSPFQQQHLHHRRYYSSQQRQLNSDAASAVPSSSPLLLATRPVRIRPSVATAYARPSTVATAAGALQQQQHLVVQQINRTGTMSMMSVGGAGGAAAAVAATASSPVSALQAVPRTIVVHKSSPLVASSDADGGGGGSASPTTMASFTNPKRFNVYSSSPHNQHPPTTEPTMLARSRHRIAEAAPNTFDILSPPAKMVKQMEFGPSVSGIVAQPESSLSSTTTTTYSVPTAPAVIDQTMPHNILDEALNEAENFVDEHQQFIQQHHGHEQQALTVDNTTKTNLDQQQQQQFCGDEAAKISYHHDQIDDGNGKETRNDDHENKTGECQEKQNNANDKAPSAKCTSSASDAEAALSLTKQQQQREGKNNIFSGSVNEGPTDEKSDIEKATVNFVGVDDDDDYEKLGVEQMRTTDPDSDKGAAALREEDAERQNVAQLFQPFERDYAEHHQPHPEDGHQLLHGVSDAFVNDPSDQQQSHQQQRHGQLRITDSAVGADEEGEQKEDEQPQQHQFAGHHYHQQQGQQQISSASDMIDAASVAPQQQHQGMNAEKEEQGQEEGHYERLYSVGEIASIAEQQHLQQLLPMSVVESSSISSAHREKRQQLQRPAIVLAEQSERHHPPTAAVVGTRRSASSSAADNVAHPSADVGNKWFHVDDLSSSTQRFVITEYSVPCDGAVTGVGFAAVEGSKNAAANEPKSMRIALQPGTLYRVRCRAVNSVGYSAWSHPANFKTCVPGFPGSPTSIKITKCPEGVYISWDPPLSPNGQIEEYSVLLLMHSPQHANNAFKCIYVGPAPNCEINHQVLGLAYVETAHTSKPAIIFRISARNEKGYGSATQVRWLQESPRVVPVSVMPPGILQPTAQDTPTTGASPLPPSADPTEHLVMPQQHQQQQYYQHILSPTQSSANIIAPSPAVGSGIRIGHKRAVSGAFQPQQQQQHRYHHYHNQRPAIASANMMSSPANPNISVREFLSNTTTAGGGIANASKRGGDLR